MMAIIFLLQSPAPRIIASSHTNKSPPVTIPEASNTNSVNLFVSLSTTASATDTGQKSTYSVSKN